MNQADTEHKSTSEAVVSHAANTRLSGSWLIMARAVWLALVVPSVGLFVVSIVVSSQQALPVQMQRSLASMGFSVSGFGILTTIFFVFIAAIWYVVGFLIFWRRSDDWLALLAAFFLVLFNSTSFGNTTSSLASASPLLAMPLNLVNFLGTASLLVFFLLFPNGRLVSRWMGLILLIVIMSAFISAFSSITSLFIATVPAWLNILGPLVVVGAVIYSQIYHYRRVSTPRERQQTKWIILGLLVAIGVLLGLFAISALIPPGVASNNLGALLFFLIVWPVALLLIPLSIGFSILRYRLYDIDVLINRTLVYGTLTVLLALLYVGLVIGLQAFVRLFTGQNAQSPVVIVASTLVIAALFQPLRHRLQAIIDRRFYRRKYDAARTVAAFSATLRNEVDLPALSEHLLAVVEETMQPAHVSLWIRPGSPRERTAYQPVPGHEQSVDQLDG